MGLELNMEFQQLIINTYAGHADLQISATDVQSLIKKFLLSEDKDNHIYMGKRQNRKTLDLFFTTMMSVITFICSGFYFKDINAQPKIFARFTC